MTKKLTKAEKAENAEERAEERAADAAEDRAEVRSLITGLTPAEIVAAEVEAAPEKPRGVFTQMGAAGGISFRKG